MSSAISDWLRGAAISDWPVKGHMTCKSDSKLSALLSSAISDWLRGATISDWPVKCYIICESDSKLISLVSSAISDWLRGAAISDWPSQEESSTSYEASWGLQQKFVAIWYLISAPGGALQVTCKLCNE